MTEQLLKKMRAQKGNLVIKEKGEVFIVVGSEEILMDQIGDKENAWFYATALQIAIEHFIGYKPEIKELAIQTR
ncbi:TPA: hypothetical protein NJY08_004776 [Salmonella enterica subsp. enterica serovar Typhi str. AG3]|nr:hypothetical protein [Salmonella enterica subsp. enterica serovar Typhi str. AG3]